MVGSFRASKRWSREGAWLRKILENLRNFLYFWTQNRTKNLFFFYDFGTILQISSQFYVLYDIPLHKIVSLKIFLRKIISF